jgi:small subunit ribosomal protein S15
LDFIDFETTHQRSLVHALGFKNSFDTWTMEKKMITKEKTAELIKTFGKNPKDTGSPEVKVAIITERINNLSSHFEGHKHDYSSKRGLMKLIGQRKQYLSYLSKTDEKRYTDLIAKLGLRK